MCIRQMCIQGTRPVLDRVQPTAIGSPPNSFRLREMASVPDSASVPSAERERGIEKTDELRRLKNARNRKFESISLQRGVRCELDFLGQRASREAWGSVGVAMGGGGVDADAPIAKGAPAPPMTLGAAAAGRGAAH